MAKVKTPETADPKKSKYTVAYRLDGQDIVTSFDTVEKQAAEVARIEKMGIVTTANKPDGDSAEQAQETGD